jgi:anion-transporting  ArsA/GET3 family ATPase
MKSSDPSSSLHLLQALNRKILFVSGKGGVGKTCVSRALAQLLARSRPRKKILWVTFEDPSRPLGVLEQTAKNLWELNCESSSAFEEYIGLKLKIPSLAKLFTQNKLMRYLAKAAPGIHELVLLGKVWFERNHYDHVVVDMPSTGYGLAMFQSTRNFSKLFQGGPLHNDAEDMLKSFHDATECAQIIVALPEEMPLQESLELNTFLLELFPHNPPFFIVNRVFPHLGDDQAEQLGPPPSWSSPLAQDGKDYAIRRSLLEKHNLRLLSEHSIRWTEIEFIPPDSKNTQQSVVAGMVEDLMTKGVTA